MKTGNMKGKKGSERLQITDDYFYFNDDYGIVGDPTNRYQITIEIE